MIDSVQTTTTIHFAMSFPTFPISIVLYTFCLVISPFTITPWNNCRFWSTVFLLWIKQSKDALYRISNTVNYKCAAVLVTVDDPRYDFNFRHMEQGKLNPQERANGSCCHQWTLVSIKPCQEFPFPHTNGNWIAIHQVMLFC